VATGRAIDQYALTFTRRIRRDLRVGRPHYPEVSSVRGLSSKLLSGARQMIVENLHFNTIIQPTDTAFRTIPLTGLSGHVRLDGFHLKTSREI
jgi:hypothetical protein